MEIAHQVVEVLFKLCFGPAFEESWAVLGTSVLSALLCLSTLHSALPTSSGGHIKAPPPTASFWMKSRIVGSALRRGCCSGTREGRVRAGATAICGCTRTTKGCCRLSSTQVRRQPRAHWSCGTGLGFLFSPWAV